MNDQVSNVVVSELEATKPVAKPEEKKADAGTEASESK